MSQRLLPRAAFTPFVSESFLCKASICFTEAPFAALTVKFKSFFYLDLLNVLADIVCVRWVECGAVAILVRPVRYGAANVTVHIFCVLI